MKPIIARWLAPCLIVSLYFADFTQAEANTPANGKRPAPRQVQRPQIQRQQAQRQVQRPQAQRQAAKPTPKRAVAAAPQQKRAAAPPVRAAANPQKRAANPAIARSQQQQQQRRKAPQQLVGQAAPGQAAPDQARAAQQNNQPKSTPAPKAAPKVAPERQAPSPVPARPATPAAPQQPARDTQAENAAAARARQAERVQDNQQRVRDNQADANREQAERAEKAADNRQQQTQQNQEILRQRQQEAQERAQQNRNVEQDRQQQNAKAAQERVEQNRDAAQQRLKENADANAQNAADRQAALRQRADDNQARVKANQDQAQDRIRDAQERAQTNNQERVRDAQERVRDAQNANQDRVRDAQDRVRENQANNQQRIAEAQSRLRVQQGERATALQERIRDAQERSRQAQADFRERQFANVQDRRAAFDNTRLLAAQAHRPIIERANMNFRPGWTGARDPGWQSRWGNTWAQVAEARNANRIANNYQRAVNWSYRPNYWGSNPWWAGNPYRQNWNRGNWAYGWNRPWFQRNNWYAPAWSGYYDDSSNVATGVAWGLASWGLGNLIYDSGYENYYNPYPVRYAYADTSFAYDQPITEIATRYPVGDGDTAQTAAAKSNAAFERSRDQFKDEDYVSALKSADEAISYTPGDSSLHEYRALIFFALGQYGDAAGVLNTVLASSPGWDYKTMVGFYRSEDAYNNQLAKLQNYAESKRDAADARFVLGYHNLVAGDLDGAATQFDEVVQLQPRDSVAKQLRDLARSSVKSPEANSEPVEGDRDTTAPAEPIDTTRLVGDWTSDRGNSSKVMLDMKDDGHFTWTFKKAEGDNKTLEGTYSIDDRGLLVLNSQDSQMVGEISMPQDNQLVFVLAGGPEGDPGLKFSKD